VISVAQCERRRRSCRFVIGCILNL